MQRYDTAKPFFFFLGQLRRQNCDSLLFVNQALNLLRASLVTSSASSFAFRSLLVKEDRFNPISKKPDRDMNSRET